jgi:hypothetical protein
MSKSPRAVATVAVAVLAFLSISLAPAQAEDLSPTAPDTGSAATEPPVPNDSLSATPEESAADGEPDAAASEPATPQDPAPAPSDTAPTSNPDATGSAASASEYTTQIVTPVDGVNVSEGWVQYTVQVATAGTYWLDFSCDGDFRNQYYLSASYDGQQLNGTLDYVYAGENCYLYLRPSDGAGTGEHIIYFAVGRPAVTPTIGNPVARPATFYPRVRDGYRDETVIAFGSRLDSDVTVQILAGTDGSIVRTFALAGDSWADYSDRRSVAWRGRNAAGNLVPTGRYTARITSTIDGQSATARLPIWVASGHRTVRVTKTKDGWDDSRDTTRGNCFAWEVFDGNDLDCWGGSYAQATYRFALPSGARNIDWGVRGYQECCDAGRIIKTGERTSARSYRIAVRVTSWRSYVVRSTWLTYTYRKAL